MDLFFGIRGFVFFTLRQFYDFLIFYLHKLRFLVEQTAGVFDGDIAVFFGADFVRNQQIFIKIAAVVG